jgi:hypothetical protein
MLPPAKPRWPLFVAALAFASWLGFVLLALAAFSHGI